MPQHNFKYIIILNEVCIMAPGVDGFISMRITGVEYMGILFGMLDVVIQV